MPGQLIVPNRRKRAGSTESDSDTEDEGNSFSDRSNSSKRTRLINEKHQKNFAPNAASSPICSPFPRPRNVGCSRPQKYAPGSVIRVRLSNFVTYTSAEFNLGPSLNMIIGPNGTGKSTLVCAICLGLGWGPGNLGRAKELGEFVKHGMREAEIEIELSAGQERDGENPVIRRVIKREGNKTSFFINNQPSTQRAVQSLARSFSIQIDNLCQFLPQDRVVEFAALSPVDLLSSTERAAAPDYLVQWHEELKQLHSEWKRNKVDQTSMKDNLANLENRQNLQRADVERLQQRKEMVTKVSALQKMRVAIRYRTATNKVRLAKERKREALNELQELEVEVEPSLRAVNDQQEQLNQVDRILSQKRNILDKAEQNAVRLDGEQAGQQQKMQKCMNDIDNEKSNIKGHNNELSQIEQTITRIERQMNNEPVEFDAAAYNIKIREKARELRSVETCMDELEQTLRDNRNQIAPKNMEIQKTNEDLDKLKSQAGQQLNKLKMVSLETWRAWEWLQDNKSLFQENVYGPPIIECSVADSRFANAIESSLQRNDLLAFTCTNQHDFKLLGQKLYGHLKLGDINIRVAKVSLSNFRPPVTSEQLQGLGLNGWLRDYLSGPDPVLSTLCDVSKIHCTGVTLDDRSADFDKLRDSPIQSWVAGREYFQVVRRREYGPSAVSTRVRRVEPAKIWTNQAVDSGAERELRKKIDELQDEISELQKQVEEGKAEYANLKTDEQRLASAKVELEEEKAAKQRVFGEFQALPTKLAALQEKKSGIVHARKQIREDITAKEADIDKIALDRAQRTLDYANAIELLRKLHVELLEAEIWHIETKSDLDAVTHRNKEVKDMLESRRDEVKALESQWNELKQSGKRLFKELDAMLKERSAEEQEIQCQLGQDISTEDLEAEIESAMARLELIQEGNTDIIREFEQRQRQIDTLKERLSSLQDSLAVKQSEIDEIRSKWEPELDELIRQISDAFSHNFSKIGCAGQVGIYKDENFDQWAIQIQVKFREHEQLSLLDSHRQSGGERAVSTIFYLMALQSLARSPFRVVDEINQGMDPRNERIVHERMVDIACKEHTSQYFLITPKLLNGLNYDERMKVHTIVSGEHVPEDYNDLNFQNMLHLARRVKGQA